MPFASSAFLSGLLLLATMQMVPAPPLLGVGATIAGAVAAADTATTAGVVGAAAGVGGLIEGGVKHKRTVPFYSRVKRTQGLGNPDLWKNCNEQLGSHYINFAPAGGSGNSSDIMVTGLPAACTQWAQGITGKIGAGNPIVMANNAMKVTGLTQEHLSEVQDAINNHEHKY